MGDLVALAGTHRERPTSFLLEVRVALQHLLALVQAEERHFLIPALALVIVLISHLDARQQAALSAGADAFISKSEMPDRVAGLVTVAAAPDFTEDGMWAEFDADQRRALRAVQLFGFKDAGAGVVRPARIALSCLARRGGAIQARRLRKVALPNTVGPHRIPAGGARGCAA